MSVEGQVLGASTVAGGTAATASSLVNTGQPVIIGTVVAIVTIIVLGLVTRAAQRA
jgi:hypothetical protein